MTGRLERSVGPVPPGAGELGDFHANDPAPVPAGRGRVALLRQREAMERAERERRLRRPARDEATAEIADSHVERVVVDGRSLRFGYGIERLVTKGALTVGALRACERFRREFEAANRGGACAVVDPTRVRVDASRRDGGVLAPVGSPAALVASLEALGGPASAASIVAVRCIAEGKTLKAAAGEIAAKRLGGDPEFARGMLVAAVQVLARRYGY